MSKREVYRSQLYTPLLGIWYTFCPCHVMDISCIVSRLLVSHRHTAYCIHSNTIYIYLSVLSSICICSYVSMAVCLVSSQHRQTRLRPAAQFTNAIYVHWSLQGFAFHADAATFNKIVNDDFSERSICELSEIRMFSMQETNMMTIVQKGSPLRKMITYG